MSSETRWESGKDDGEGLGSSVLLAPLVSEMRTRIPFNSDFMDSRHWKGVND